MAIFVPPTFLAQRLQPGHSPRSSILLLTVWGMSYRSAQLPLLIRRQYWSAHFLALVIGLEQLTLVKTGRARLKPFLDQTPDSSESFTFLSLCRRHSITSLSLILTILAGPARLDHGLYGRPSRAMLEASRGLDTFPRSKPKINREVRKWNYKL
jgi:hypothetical protein